MSARRTRTRSLCAPVGAPGPAPNTAAQVYQIDEILTLAERYASARRMSEATLSYRATRSSTWLERCARGRVTLHSAIAFVQWLCDHWPPGLAWPERIERPEVGAKRCVGSGPRRREARISRTPGAKQADCLCRGALHRTRDPALGVPRRGAPLPRRGGRAALATRRERERTHAHRAQRRTRRALRRAALSAGA